MATATISFSDRDTEADFNAKFHQVVLHAKQPLNGQLTELEGKIASLERRYEMPSEEMKQLLSSGKQRETDEICQWLMMLDLRENARNSIAADEARG